MLPSARRFSGEHRVSPTSSVSVMNVMVDEYIDHYNPSTASGPPPFNKGGIFYFKKALRNGTEFAFCEWVPYVVKTNSVFNKLRIYANTSFVFPLSKKSYDFSEALIVPPSKRQKRQKVQKFDISAPFHIHY